MSRHNVILSISIALPQAIHFLFLYYWLSNHLWIRCQKVFSVYLVYNTFTKICLWNKSWEKQNPTSEKLSSSNSSLMIIIFSVRTNTLWIKLGLIFLNSKIYFFKAPFPAKISYALLYYPLARINVRNMVLAKKQPSNFPYIY